MDYAQLGLLKITPPSMQAPPSAKGAFLEALKRELHSMKVDMTYDQARMAFYGTVAGKPAAITMEELLNRQEYQMYPGMRALPDRPLLDRIAGDAISRFWSESLRTALRETVEEETEHRKTRNLMLRWVSGPNGEAQFGLTCASCEKTFRLNVPGQKIADLRRKFPTSWEREFVDEWFAPWFGEIHDEPCYGAREAALLAEWLTSRLASAGPKGMPYVQLVHEAVEGRMVPPRDVDMMLRKMRFIEDWVKLANSGLILPGSWDGEWTLPILTLPEGHPSRDW